MRITNIGGATAIVEHAGKRILFDPWMNEGALYGSWHHFPPLKMRIEDLGHLDYVYISHIHEDHCAPGTIERLNRDAEIIVMDREPAIPNFVTKFLANYNFNFRKVHRIRPYTPQEIAPGLIVDMVEADPQNEYNYLVDSGLILKWGGRVLYNANDCEPSTRALEYVATSYGKPDIALLPYTGGSGYPACYSNLSDAEKQAEKTRIIDRFLKSFVDAVRTLDPGLVMPFADQYVIVGSRHRMNEFAAHPPCPGSCAEPLRQAGLDHKLLLLNSAQTFELETRRKTPDEPYQMFSEEERNFYARSLADRKYAHEEVTFGLNVPIARLTARAREHLWDVQRKDSYFPASRLYLDVTDRKRRFEIDLSKEGVVESKLDNGGTLCEPYLRISMPSTLLAMMLINHVSWNMADGARLLDYERVPNVYDPKLYAYLNHLIV